MSVAGTQTSESETPSVADRIVDAVQHAAHVSHEARLVKSLAYDAIEDGAHKAKRAVDKSVQRGIEKLEDIKDESVHYVKHEPLKAMAMAAGVGLMVGMATAWITGRFFSSKGPAGNRSFVDITHLLHPQRISFGPSPRVNDAT
jgi:ElaB/YqjD/DUF883 family membrane-anchored ribosome-binding protein